MATQNFFRQVVIGQMNIDRMKREIDQFVNTLIGMLPATYVWPTIQIGNYTWRFRKSPWDQLHIECRVTGHDDFLYDSLNGSHEIPLLHVQEIHTSLSEFVTQLVSSFPNLEILFMPFTEAADYKF